MAASALTAADRDALLGAVDAVRAKVAALPVVEEPVPDPKPDPVPPPPPPSPPPPVPADECPECGFARDLLLSLPDTKVVGPGEVLEISGAQTIPNLLVRGTLRHLDGSLLHTRTVLIDHGTWQAGTPEAPVSFGVEIADAGSFDPASDPQAIGGGVIVHGRVRLYGTGPDKARIYSANPARIDARGHLMLMENDADIRDVGIDDMGRTDKSKPITDAPDLTNKRGRYPLHFHLAGTGQPPANVERVRIRRSPGWAFVNHGSSVDFIDCTDADCFGAGVVTETGGETGGVTNHTSVGVRGTVVGNLNDPAQNGVAGHGAWVQGGGPFQVDGLRVDGCPGIGVVLMGTPDVDVPVSRLPDDADYKPLKDWCAANGVTSLPSHDVPFFFRNLDVRSTDPTGLYLWSNCNPSVHPCRSLIADSTFHQCSIVSGYSNKTDHRRVRVLGNPAAPVRCGIGHTGVVDGHGYYDCEVTGWGIGLQAPSRGTNAIRGGTWANVVDFLFLNQSDPAVGRSVTVEVAESNFTPLAVDPAAHPINFNGDTLPPGRWRYARVMWFVWIHIDRIKRLAPDDPWAPNIFDARQTLGDDRVRVPHTATGEPVYIHPYELDRGYPLDGLPIKDDLLVRPDGTRRETSGQLYDETGYALWGTVPVAGQSMPGLYGVWTAEPAVVIDNPPVPAA